MSAIHYHALILFTPFHTFRLFTRRSMHVTRDVFIDREYRFNVDFIQYPQHASRQSRGRPVWKFFMRSSYQHQQPSQIELPYGWIRLHFGDTIGSHVFCLIPSFDLERDPCYDWLTWHTMCPANLPNDVRVLRIRDGKDERDSTLNTKIGTSITASTWEDYYSTREIQEQNQLKQKLLELKLQTPRKRSLDFLLGDGIGDHPNRNDRPKLPATPHPLARRPRLSVSRPPPLIPILRVPTQSSSPSPPSPQLPMPQQTIMSQHSSVYSSSSSRSSPSSSSSSSSASSSSSSAPVIAAICRTSLEANAARCAMDLSVRPRELDQTVLDSTRTRRQGEPAPTPVVQHPPLRFACSHQPHGVEYDAPSENLDPLHPPDSTAYKTTPTDGNSK